MVNKELSRSARRGLIFELLTRSRVHSQAELLDLLHQEGVVVTQATLSRDLDQLGAQKIRPHGLRGYYVVPGVKLEPDEYVPSQLDQMLADLVIYVGASGALVVLKTPPGAAQYVASFIDRDVLPDVVGAVAGDDTIFVLAREPVAGKELAREFIARAESAHCPCDTKK